MMRPVSISSLHILELSILLFFLTACAGIPTARQGEVPGSSPTKELPPTPSPAAASPTITPTRRPPTETPRPTPTLAPTDTPEPLQLSVNHDIACLIGPGPVYGIRAYLVSGSSPVPLGRTADGSWWFVQYEDSGSSCWVEGESITVTGEAASMPVLTPDPTPTSQPTPTQKLNGVRYYLIDPDTGGPFGCGDGLVYFTAESPPTGDVEKDIKAALRALFKLKVKFVGQYYNPVHNAHLIVNEVNFDSATGKVVIHLSGSIPKPADVCEAERIHAVVWETVRKFPGVNSVGIWVGSFLLGDLIAVGDR